MRFFLSWRALALAGAVGIGIPGVAPGQTTDGAGLQKALHGVAERARPASFGLAVLDLQSGAHWGVHATQAYPIMSVFKAPVAAAVLAQVDAGKLSLDKPVTLERADVQEGSAVPSIGSQFTGERMTFPVRRLLQAAVSESDNTAVDALIRVVGGPGVVTAFLRSHGIDGMRVDEDERQVSAVFDNLGGQAKPPTGETAAQEARRAQGGYRAFMADPRNRATPEAATLFLKKLWTGELLSQGSTKLLLGMMEAQTTPHRLRDGLPRGIRLADKTGTAGEVGGLVAAWNDIGIVLWPDGHAVAVAGFLSGTRLQPAERNALFAEVARETVRALGR